MPKNQLEAAIEKLAAEFAASLVDAVRQSTLEELVQMQDVPTGRRRGRKPGRKAAAKKTGARRGRPPKKKSAGKATSKPTVKKKRTINYPKCQVEGCNRNRWARGQGFCGTHFKEFQAGLYDASGKPVS